MKTLFLLLFFVMLSYTCLQAQGWQLEGNVRMNMQQGTQMNLTAGSSTLQVGNASTLQGVGTITGNLTNNGTLQIGNPTGTMTINGTFNNNATLDMQLAGISPSQYDLIVVNGNGIVAGTINVSYLSGYTLPAATDVDIITTTGLTYSAATNSPPTAPVLHTSQNVYLGLGVYLSATIIELKGERTTENEISLNWKTISETNNKGFEVEFSENAQNFQSIGFVEGAGNSLTPKNYQFKHNNTSGGYFRLKQMSIDGKYTYSNIVYISGLDAILVYPNPSNGNFAVEVGKHTDKLPVRILDIKGAEVWKGQLTEATNQLKTDLPTGTYLLQIFKNNKPQTVKIVVTR